MVRFVLVNVSTLEMDVFADEALQIVRIVFLDHDVFFY